ncbi:MAG: septum formation initiator family protein [Candidatus Pacebacteria bacterium]|nr:septum formation initiator family protein [Candidatus Paceibacterota bacterium]MCF7863090.1 septum formation initiator family protein [Candidatus Paceibacterota bacterium]
MYSFQNKKSNFRKVLESKPFLVFLAIVLVAFAWNLFGFLQKVGDIEKNRQVAEQKVDILKEKKDLLEKDIDRLGTQKGIEENIREKFGLIKEGERVIVIVDDTKNTVLVEEEPISLWQRFKGFFKKE